MALENELHDIAQRLERSPDDYDLKSPKSPELPRAQFADQKPSINSFAEIEAEKAEFQKMFPAKSDVCSFLFRGFHAQQRRGYSVVDVPKPDPMTTRLSFRRMKPNEATITRDHIERLNITDDIDDNAGLDIHTDT